LAAVRKRLLVLAALAAVLALLLSACTSGDEGGSSGQSAFVTTEDGLVLRGRYYAGGLTTHSIILAHAYDSSQSSWGALKDSLVARGYAVLALDFRGHGDSPGKKEPGIADADLTAAYRYLRRSSNNQGKIFLIGASLGGTASLKVAAREETQGVIALSAPTSIRGLDAGSDVPRIAEAKLFIAAQGDGRYASDAQAMFDSAREPRQIQLVSGSAHGTDLLKGANADRVRSLIFDFLEKNK
jgi:esterase/lipase